MKLPSKTVEKKFFAGGYNYIIAVDEVGMGCLAGPVVVCAVMFDKKFFSKQHRKLSWLRDSKLLQAKQREKFAKELLQVVDFKFQVAYCYPKTIDRLNIYQAARMAMKRAVGKLAIQPALDPRLFARDSDSNSLAPRFAGPPPRAGTFDDQFSSGCIANLPRTIVLVDGKTKITALSLEQMPIVKGDRKVFSISCASILAKVFRDKMMARYAKKFPDYGFEKHKGYGTKEHRAKLIKLGPCAIHRKSFGPVAKLL